jgi:hypothetical protein
LALNFDWQHRRKAVDSRDPKRVLTMVCFPALQFNTAKKQFMATRKVPIAAIEDENLRDCTGPVAVVR